MQYVFLKIMNSNLERIHWQKAVAESARLLLERDTPGKQPLPNSIEDVTGIDEITELWRSHFKQLFNCIRDMDIQQIKLM